MLLLKAYHQPSSATLITNPHQTSSSNLINSPKQLSLSQKKPTSPKKDESRLTPLLDNVPFPTLSRITPELLPNYSPHHSPHHSPLTHSFQVIRRYLKVNELRLLVRYLRALLRARLGAPEHLLLALESLCRLGDEPQLDELVGEMVRDASEIRAGSVGEARVGFFLIRRHAPFFPICRTPFPPYVRN